MKHNFLICSFIILFMLSGCCSLSAQNRWSSHNTLIWLNTFHTFNLNKKIAILAEYQWRRTNVLDNWQQSLLRTGFQYKFSNNISVLVGYAWTENFPYGDFPPTARQPFPEHRIYEQLMWNDQKGPFTIQHRLRMEQRFLGQLNPDSEQERTITQWNYLNRIRYQLKLTVPLNKATLTDHTLYMAAFDEIFIGFGKKADWNIFDQNRIGLQLGYKINNKISIEAAWFNQTLQQSRLVQDKPVFQYNQGFMINLIGNWN